jgi:hypothetical protein
MTPVGFEATISVGERPQTYALDRLATGTGYTNFSHTKYLAALKTEREWNIFKLLSTHLFAAVSSQP